MLQLKGYDYGSCLFVSLVFHQVEYVRKGKKVK